MSSEKEEFDEKLFKKPMGEGRAGGEIAETVEVCPATASRRRAMPYPKPTPAARGERGDGHGKKRATLPSTRSR